MAATWPCTELLPAFAFYVGRYAASAGGPSAGCAAVRADLQRHKCSAAHSAHDRAGPARDRTAATWPRLPPAGARALRREVRGERGRSERRVCCRASTPPAPQCSAAPQLRRRRTLRGAAGVRPTFRRARLFASPVRDSNEDHHRGATDRRGAAALRTRSRAGLGAGHAHPSPASPVARQGASSSARAARSANPTRNRSHAHVRVVRALSTAVGSRHPRSSVRRRHRSCTMEPS